MITYNTYLNFLRLAYPELEDDRLKEMARVYMKLQHEFYRGVKDENVNN